MDDDRRHRVAEKTLAGEETAQRQLVERLTPVIQARVGQWLLHADPGDGGAKRPGSSGTS